MPDTQQQSLWLVREIDYLDSKAQLSHGQQGDWAAYLAATWPSSPQGQAVKALVKAAQDLADIVGEREQGNHDLDEELTAVDTALDVARKAGME